MRISTENPGISTSSLCANTGDCPDTPPSRRWGRGFSRAWPWSEMSHPASPGRPSGSPSACGCYSHKSHGSFQNALYFSGTVRRIPSEIPGSRGLLFFHESRAQQWWTPARALFRALRPVIPVYPLAYLLRMSFSLFPPSLHSVRLPYALVR